jgi:type IV secretion system protein VirB10
MRTVNARAVGVLFLLAGAAAGQEASAPPENEPKLRSRTEVAAPAPAAAIPSGDLLVIPAGTKIPLELRQPISTKGAQPGDAIYAQTTFPIVLSGSMAIPAGTWVQGVVDAVKRAGRIKGTAELSFHLTNLVYANGYTVDMAAAIDKVPGDTPTSTREPGTVAHDSEKGKDLERVGDAASKGGQIGALAGAAARPSIRGFGVGGVAGIAAGTLIALLARGSDVTFPTGTAVEIALTHAIAVERQKAMRTAAPQ